MSKKELRDFINNSFMNKNSENQDDFQNFEKPTPKKELQKIYNKSNKYPISKSEFHNVVLPKMYNYVHKDVKEAASRGLDSVVVRLVDKSDPNPTILTDVSTASRYNKNCDSTFNIFKKQYEKAGYVVSNLDNIYCKFSINWGQ